MPKVFISHSSKDKPAAEAALYVLEKNGVSCWIAPRDIPPGAQWAEAVLDGIEKCSFFVLLFSESANQSPQVSREVERAVHKGLIIIPVRLEDVMPKKALEYFISGAHWMDAFPKPFEEYLEALTHSIQRFDSESSSQPQTSPGSVDLVGRQGTTQQSRQQKFSLFSKVAAETKKWVRRITIGFAVAGVGFLIAFFYGLGNHPPGNDRGSSAKPDVQPEIRPEILDGVTYTLEDWGWEGNSLVFWVIALNKKGDTTIRLHVSTAVVDDRGDQHVVSLRMLGDRRSGTDVCIVPLRSEVSTRFGLKFAGVPPSIKSVQLLEITLTELGTIKFANIPVAGRTLKANH